MSNPYLTHLAELRQLDASLDQRLELIQKAETNLKSLLEALRNQVTNAYPVLNELKKLVHQADQRAEEIRSLSEKTGMVPESLEQMSHELESAIQQAKQDIDSFAAPIRQQMIDELRAVVQAAKSSLSSMQTTIPGVSDNSDHRQILDRISEGFRIEADRVIESVRQKLMDQVDLLRTEAQLQIDPILNQLTIAQQAAGQQIEDLARAHEKSLQHRVQQIGSSVQEITLCLEERLTQRLDSMRRRAEQALTQIESVMNQRTDQFLARMEESIRSGQEQLVSQLEGIYPRIDHQLRDAERVLLERVRQMEQHASAMSSYLEKKLVSEVDELIHRLRLKLQHEIATVTGTAIPVTRITHPDVPPRPEVEVEVFVGKKGKMSSKDSASMSETEKMA